MTSQDSIVAPPLRILFEREPGWEFSLMLVLLVIFLFVALPALSVGQAERDLFTLLQFTLAAVAIALLARSTWLRIALAASFGLTLLARFLPGVMPQTTTLSMALLYNCLVTGAMVRAVFGPGEVNHHRIAGAIFIYLNVVVLFALSYSILMLFVPDAISSLSANMPYRASQIIHFSFTTMTAMGDGNAAPHSPFARSLADLETVIGQLFPAILLSRLVGLHLSRSLGS